MLQPRRITSDAIPAALEKALRYRLLNEPLEAESICRDILAIQPNHQQALTTLLLALTDQFGHTSGGDLEPVKEIVGQISDPYEREYFSGIIYERWGKSLLEKGTPERAAGWLLEAMRYFDKASEFRGGGEPDAILRWNTCARMLQRYGLDIDTLTSVSHDVNSHYGDDVPPR